MKTERRGLIQVMSRREQLSEASLHGWGCLPDVLPFGVRTDSLLQYEVPKVGPRNREQSQKTLVRVGGEGLTPTA